MAAVGLVQKRHFTNSISKTVVISRWNPLTAVRTPASDGRGTRGGSNAHRKGNYVT